MRKAALFLLISLFLYSGVSLYCRPERGEVYQAQALGVDFLISGLTSEEIRNLSLSYHLYSPDGKMFKFENPRFRPEGRKFRLRVFFPIPGDYIVEFELLKEGGFWGRDRGWRPCKFRLRVLPLFSRGFREKYLNFFIPFREESFRKIQYLIRITYKNNEIWKGGRFFGFSAGSSYPQVWIRDMASAVEYALKFYPIKDLERSVENFLLFQHSDGEVFGWISPDYRLGKNSISSDQESSLVLASLPLARKDPSWLCRKIRGKRVIDRLQEALLWVWRERREKTGLIWSGFKADWGDLYPFRSSDPNHLHSGDLRVVGVYTQARFFRALRALEEMEGYCKPRIRIPLRAMAKEIRENSRRFLYLQREGYFLIHRVLGHPEYLPLERGIFALGGNAEAALAGFFTREEFSLLLRVQRGRMHRLSLFSPSFVLLPPYPQGFFKFHLMKPWHYQNGGGWDWIGARMAAAAVKYGFRSRAREYLREMCRRNLRWMSVYEWFDREGRGKGAYFYTAAAGEMARALILLARAPR